MRILVTGAGGFVGRHLLRDLLQNGHAVVAFSHAPLPDPRRLAQTAVGDILDAGRVDGLVAEAVPDACIHLTAVTFVPQGWSDPRQMFAVNVLGTLNVLEAFRRRAPRARLLIVSSAEVYGPAPEQHLQTEQAPLQPDNPYAISKAAADLTALACARHHGLHVLTARPCNHIGPGQSPKFVVASFAAQLAAMARGTAPRILKVGNLDNRRDFTDARDVARAYRLLIEKGRPGEAYNIAAGREVTIREILDRLCALAGIQPTLEIDTERFRPVESRLRLDTRKIESETGWKPEIPLPDTLREIYAAAFQSGSGGTGAK